jgi:hypothetical protein
MLKAQQLATLCKLAREGKLSLGDGEMADLFTPPDEPAESLSSESLTGITVDGLVFTRDCASVKLWNITIRGLSIHEGGKNEEYAGSICFPPEFPSLAPILLYSDHKSGLDGLDLCGTVIRNSRMVEGWDDEQCGDNDVLSEIDESLELDLIPVFDSKRGEWRSVFWMEDIPVRECLENLRDFLHHGLREALKRNQGRPSQTLAEDKYIKPVTSCPWDSAASSRKISRRTDSANEIDVARGRGRLAGNVESLMHKHEHAPPVFLCQISENKMSFFNKSKKRCLKSKDELAAHLIACYQRCQQDPDTPRAAANKRVVTARQVEVTPRPDGVASIQAQKLLARAIREADLGLNNVQIDSIVSMAISDGEGLEAIKYEPFITDTVAPIIIENLEMRKLDRRREEVMVDTLHHLFEQAKVAWRWQRSSLPFPEASLQDLKEGDGRESVSASGQGVGRRMRLQSAAALSIHCGGADDDDQDVLPEDEGSGGLAREGEQDSTETLQDWDALLGAWLVVAVVGERWGLCETGDTRLGFFETRDTGESRDAGESRATGETGGVSKLNNEKHARGAGKGGEQVWAEEELARRCQRLLQRNNGFAVVVRLHSQLPRELRC